MGTGKSTLFSENEESKIWSGDFKAEAKEKGPLPADFLWEPASPPREGTFVPEFGTKPPVVTSLGLKDAFLQTGVAPGFPETSVHYEVGDHEVLEQDSEEEPYHLCDASKVNVACEEALSVKEDGFAHADVAATSVEVHELLQEDLETNSQKILEEAEWYGKIYELRRGPGRVQI